MNRLPTASCRRPWPWLWPHNIKKRLGLLVSAGKVVVPPSVDHAAGVGQL